MDISEIKREAWEKIKGNKWKLIWPLLVIGLISTCIQKILGLILAPNLASFITTLVIGAFSSAYIPYILAFVRGEEFTYNTIINCIKEKWLVLLTTYIIYYIIVFIGTLLLVVPGIILAIMYGLCMYLVVDTDQKNMDALNTSKEMMNGHKKEYFLLCLSFIGWVLLGAITLGIGLIWVVPYMNVAGTLYYERLKGNTPKKEEVKEAEDATETEVIEEK